MNVINAIQHKRAHLKVEEGVCLSLEAICRAKEEGENTWLEAGEKVRLFEEAILKS